MLGYLSLAMALFSASTTVLFGRVNRQLRKQLGAVTELLNRVSAVVVSDPLPLPSDPPRRTMTALPVAPIIVDSAPVLTPVYRAPAVRVPAPTTQTNPSDSPQAVFRAATGVAE